MPQMGFDMQEGTLVRWLKAPGDPVQRGEPIAEVETDKAVVEIESFHSGVVKELLIGEGQTVPVGTPIAIIDTGEADADVGEPQTEAPCGASAPAAPAVASSTTSAALAAVVATAQAATTAEPPAAPAAPAPATEGAPPAGRIGSQRIKASSLA